MSMYTQLLDAALGQRPPFQTDMTEERAVEQVVRCREELAEGVPPGIDPDTVPAVLALQIAYDVALLELARVVGVDSGAARFEQPRLERERLERAFGALGIDLEAVENSEPVPHNS
jgi:hypothetical protein